MKKIILSLAFNCILALGIQAQQGLYVGAGFGYGFRAGSTITGSNANADGSSKIVKGSYGAGMIPNLSVGYLFTKSIGAQLDLGYLIGTKAEVKDENGNSRGTTDYRANSFYLNPSLVIRANTESKFVPYAKLGLFFGVGNSGTVKQDQSNYSGAQQLTQTNESKLQYKGGISTGVTSAFGLDIMLSDKLAVFGELTGRLASWAPHSYTATNTTTNYAGGNPQPAQQSSVSGNYVKETPANYAGTNASSVILPFSSIGFNVGVKLYLSK
jgi:hypothetical protein